jgi:hypothetical protein
MQMVECRAQGDLRGTQVKASIGQHNCIDLCYFSSSTSGPDDPQARNNAFVATETLLGEELLDEWIGAIEVQPIRRPTVLNKLLGRCPKTHTMSLDRSKPTVDALIAAIQEQLPPEPLYKVLKSQDAAEERRYAVFKRDPVAADDYPRREDIFVGVGCERLYHALHAPLFYSKR